MILETPLLFRSNFKELLEFNKIIEGIINVSSVQDLKKYSQHMNTSRYQHSINVAYYTYKICIRLKIDYKSATIGALLHDYYFYNWKESKKELTDSHSEIHPKIALCNTKKIIETNHIIDLFYLLLFSII